MNVEHCTDLKCFIHRSYCTVFVLFCTVFFPCIYVIIICFFKAASLDGHMAFLVAVDYVIFYWFYFFMQVWRINSSSSTSTVRRKLIDLKAISKRTEKVTIAH